MRDIHTMSPCSDAVFTISPSCALWKLLSPKSSSCPWCHLQAGSMLSAASGSGAQIPCPAAGQHPRGCMRTQVTGCMHAATGQAWQGAGHGGAHWPEGGSWSIPQRTLASWRPVTVRSSSYRPFRGRRDCRSTQALNTTVLGPMASDPSSLVAVMESRPSCTVTAGS